MNLQERLVLLRRSSGVTQKQLANELGLTEIGIQHYEAGRRKPAYDALISLATFFDVPLDYLVGRGIFECWDKIVARKEAVFAILVELYPNLFTHSQLTSLSDNQLMRLLDALLAKIEFGGDTITLFPRLPLAKQ